MGEIDILRELVKFNTIKDKDNAKILDYIQEYLEKLGFTLEKRDKYLVMKKGENTGVSFVGHSDTVEFIDGWKTNPHTLTQIDNMLYGLGSCDMKGGIACFLEALRNIDLNNLKRGIKVCITYDEEIGFGGIEEVVRENVDLGENIIVGEPTANVPMTACKGLYAVKIYTKGIKVHSSTPDRGKSANTLMIKLLSELEEYYLSNIKGEKKEIFPVSYTTMNIGLLNGGSAINSVAAECMSYVDFRTIEEKHHEMLSNKLDELCKKYDGTYIKDVNVLPFYNEVDFVTNPDAASFMTEASFLKGNRVILGPGPMTAHEIDEHVSVESLQDCVNQYVDIINKLCF